MPDEEKQKFVSDLMSVLKMDDPSLPGRVRALEQRIDSFMNVLGRIFDLNWDKPDDRSVLISIRESITFSAKLQRMENPSFDQLVEYVRKAMKAEETRSKNAMSYVRLLVAGLIGMVLTILATKLGLK